MYIVLFGLSNICLGTWQYCHITNNIIIMSNHEIIPSKRDFPNISHCSSKMKRVTNKIDEFASLLSSLENCIIKTHKVLIALWKMIEFIIMIFTFIILFSSTL